MLAPEARGRTLSAHLRTSSLAPTLRNPPVRCKVLCWVAKHVSMNVTTKYRRLRLSRSTPLFFGHGWTAPGDPTTPVMAV